MNLERLVKKAESLSQEERDQFLLDALCFKDKTAIEFAILCGADISMYSNYPIQRAIEQNWPEIVQLLIDEGVNATANDNAAIKLASQYNRDSIISILESAGAHL